MASAQSDESGSFCVGLRHAFVTIDAASLEPVSLAEIWKELVAEQLAMLDVFVTDDRHLIILEGPLAGSERAKLNGPALEMLEQVLLGHPQKVVAIDHDVSASTVAGTLTETLRALGLRTVGSRLPLALVLLFHAYRGEGAVAKGRVSYFDVAGRHLKIVSIPRVESSLSSHLSPAEFEVTRLRAEGFSHAEIAARRKASRRTIANQVASASRKLGIAGRGNLMSYVSRANSPRDKLPAGGA